MNERRTTTRSIFVGLAVGILLAWPAVLGVLQYIRPSVSSERILNCLRSELRENEIASSAMQRVLAAEGTCITTSERDFLSEKSASIKYSDHQKAYRLPDRRLILCIVPVPGNDSFRHVLTADMNILIVSEQSIVTDGRRKRRGVPGKWHGDGQEDVTGKAM